MGIERNGAPIACNGLGGTACAQKRVAEIGMGLCQIGANRQGIGNQADRLVRMALVKSDDTQQMQSVGVPRNAPKDSAIMSFCTREPAGLLMFESRQQVPFRPWPS